MKRYFVKPGAKFHLDDIDPSEAGDFDGGEKEEQKAREKTEKIVLQLDDLQEKLYAAADRSVLIVLQGIDTAGKDGVIKHVMASLNPQGCRVSSFKFPTHEESAHDFLWRIHKDTPPKGFISIFNRSHYEDVIAPRVHGRLSDKTLGQRYRQINEFERLLMQNRTTVLKFFLHISKEEQRQRLQERADNPKKHWKFSINDIRERRFWDRYQKVFRDMIRETSTKHAPWVVVPSNHKWYRNYVVGKILEKTLKDMKLRFPPGPKDIDFKNIKIR